MVWGRMPVVLSLMSLCGSAAWAEEKEPAAIVELGAAGEWDFPQGKFGPSAAIEFEAAAHLAGNCNVGREMDHTILGQLASGVQALDFRLCCARAKPDLVTKPRTRGIPFRTARPRISIGR
jgi:hypothetical protein